MARRKHPYRRMRARYPVNLRRINNFVYDASGVVLGVGVLSAIVGISGSIGKGP